MYNKYRYVDLNVEAALEKLLTFRAMDKLWKSKIIGRAIFNSTVNDILLYAS